MQVYGEICKGTVYDFLPYKSQMLEAILTCLRKRKGECILIYPCNEPCNRAK